VSLLPAPSINADAAVEAVGAVPDSPTVFAGDQNKRLWSWVNRFEWLTVWLIVFLAVALHIRFVTQVGGLWRDETNSVNLATLATFGEVWHFLDYDSFPILFFAVLRKWAGMFGPANDAALRALGLITGFGVLGALWASARAFGVRWPILSLALIGLNPMLIRYGDSTRAYGLGMLLILLTFRSFWRLVDQPSQPDARRVLAATALALLSVQCLYYNSVLLLAIAAGTVAVAVRTRAWRTVGIVLGIGILAAASLLPYVPMMRRMHVWTFLVKGPIDLPWLWKCACEVIGSPDPLGIWLWGSLFAVGLIVATVFGGSDLWQGFAQRRILGSDVDPDSASPGLSAIRARSPMPAAVLFAAVALGVAVPAYAGFLWVLSYHTNPWYYITLAAFVACTLDIVFGAWPTSAKLLPVTLPLRGVRLVVAVMLLCLAGLPAWEEMPTRQTNVDLLAAQLRSRATKSDVILISHWQYAITLYRYYHGPAEILTVPPIEDLRFHRYDLVLRQMMTADPLRPILARMGNVLRSGHRVFVVGMLPFPQADNLSQILPPTYRDADGHWHGGLDGQVWRLETGHFLRAHATRGGPIEIPVPGHARVQEFENLKLIVLEGWRQAL
jgi:hypothetical protein